MQLTTYMIYSVKYCFPWLSSLHSMLGVWYCNVLFALFVVMPIDLYNSLAKKQGETILQENYLYSLPMHSCRNYSMLITIIQFQPQ